METPRSNTTGKNEEERNPFRARITKCGPKEHEHGIGKEFRSMTRESTK
jgi:hypothetical protein